MNGMRMNQSVAPTSFITSISRRRANIAVRIVFQISRTAANSRAIDRITVYSPTKPLQLGDDVELLLGEDDVRTRSGSSREAVAQLAQGVDVGAVGRDDLVLRRDVRLGRAARSVAGSPASSALGLGERARRRRSTSQLVDLLRLRGRARSRSRPAGRRLARRVDVDDHLDAALPLRRGGCRSRAASAASARRSAARRPT